MLTSILSARERRLHNALLRRAASPEEVVQLSREIGFDYFTHYADNSAQKRREFQVVIDHLRIDLNGMSVADIGPGTGDSLEVARDRGAARTVAFELEPFFSRYLELKGHECVRGNYLNWPYFQSGRFDLVWSKGGINCEWVNSSDFVTKVKNRVRRFDFRKWVEAVKRLGRHVILVPAMGRRNTQIHAPELNLRTYHWCEDVEAYKQSYFTRTLIDAGFQMLDGIEGHNHPQAFPVTFCYDGSSGSSTR